LEKGDDENASASKVYALDCEMVRTTKKHELARISLVNEDEELIIDMYIKVRACPKSRVKNDRFFP